MIKGFSHLDGAVKKGALFLAMSASTLMFATKPIKNAMAEEKNNTEVVSKASAEAIKASVAPQVSGTVPTVHNTKLDNTMRKYIESADDKKMVDIFLNDTYKNCGTFLASAYVQHEIDTQQFYAFLNGNTKLLKKNNINPALAEEIEGYGPNFYKSLTTHVESIKNWYKEKFNPFMMSNIFDLDHQPTAEEMSKKIDHYVVNNSGFHNDECIEYWRSQRNFQEKELKNRTDTQSMSDLIAFKMYLVDMITLRKVLGQSQAFDSSSYKNNKYTFKNYYKFWMDSVKPKAN